MCVRESEKEIVCVYLCVCAFVKEVEKTKTREKRNPEKSMFRISDEFFRTPRFYFVPEFKEIKSEQNIKKGSSRVDVFKSFFCSVSKIE